MKILQQQIFILHRNLPKNVLIYEIIATQIGTDTKNIANSF